MNEENTRIYDHLPSGLVPRIEYTKRHIGFVASHFTLSYIMINLDIVERLANKNLTAHELFPSGEVITTSTIHDSKLCKYTVEDEIDIIKRFDPAWHIPCDYPVYFEDSSEGRRWFIQGHVEDTLTFMHAMKGTSIRTIPLVKGIDKSEWKLSTLPFQNEGINYFAFYVKQYFGGRYGKNDQLMVEHVRSIIASTHPEYLMLVGYQSPVRIQNLPPQVKAFSGERWIKECGINRLSADEARLQYIEWEENFRQRGKRRQNVLDILEDNITLEEY